MIQFSCLTGHVCETNCNLLNKIANATATHAKNEMRLQWNYGKLFRQFRTFSRLHSNQRQSQDHHHHHGRSRLRLGAICDTDCSDSWHAAWTALACDMCSCLKKRAENTWRWVGGTPRKMTMKEWGKKKRCHQRWRPTIKVLLIRSLKSLVYILSQKLFFTHHKAPGRPPPEERGPLEPRASLPAARSGSGRACGPQWDWPPQPGRAQWVPTWSPRHWSREWSPPCSPQCEWSHRAQPESTDLWIKI